MQTKQFSMSAVLSCYTGWLFGDIGEVYETLSFLTGETLFTHQIPRAMRQCRQHLESVLSWLPDVEREIAASRDACIAAQGKDGLPSWSHAMFDSLIERYGDSFGLCPLPPGENGPRDPMQELAEMVGSANVVVVKVGDDSAAE